MHKLSIQSTGAIAQHDLEKGYRQIAEAGFHCVDFGFDSFLQGWMIQNDNINKVFLRPIEEIWEDFKPHAELAAKYGLTFEQSHAPFPLKTPGRDNLNKKMMQATENCFAIAHRMGSRYIVEHPVHLWNAAREEQYVYNKEMYLSLIAMAKEYKLTVCLENLFVERNAHLFEGMGSDIAESVRLIDELNEAAGEELFGFCFDTGHANLLGKNMYQSLTMLGNRLKILHIHDNDGVSDLHTMPFTFERSWNSCATDWEGFLCGLHDIHYEGVLNFEVFRLMNSFPEEIHPAVLRLLEETGQYFSKKIQESADGKRKDENP